MDPYCILNVALTRYMCMSRTRDLTQVKMPALVPFESKTLLANTRNDKRASRVCLSQKVSIDRHSVAQLHNYFVLRKHFVPFHITRRFHRGRRVGNPNECNGSRRRLRYTNRLGFSRLRQAGKSFIRGHGFLNPQV